MEQMQNHSPAFSDEETSLGPEAWRSIGGIAAAVVRRAQMEREAAARERSVKPPLAA